MRSLCCTLLLRNCVYRQIKLIDGQRYLDHCANREGDDVVFKYKRCFCNYTSVLLLRLPTRLLGGFLLELRKKEPIYTEVGRQC